ncbi:MAG: hypothetical protein HC851_18745 [Acaryochloris sp. RU_4_1]|nr:hypothetical protein [Acaryochloris sp. RU_4_1]NJR57055.1 hypothetical protein [Acaryochloris sp. CRU_2_0]
MDCSYPKPTEIHCPHCNQMVTINVGLIVDQADQPDSIQNIIEGSFKTHLCPNCTQNLSEVDQPVLIYRPKQQPPLLFAPALKNTLAEDQTHTLQPIFAQGV